MRNRRLAAPAFFCLLSLALANAALAASPESDAILDKLSLHETTKPILDAERQPDPEYLAVHRAEENLYVVRKAVLIGELLRADPANEALAELLPFRWENGIRIPGLDISPEIDTYAALESANAETVELGRYHQANLAVRMNFREPDLALAEAEKFIVQYPKNERGADLLYQVSQRLGAEPERRQALMDRIITNYPDSVFAARAQGEKRRIEAVGGPFEFTFTNQLNGETVSMADFAGKVVVIDFWATWCGPCVAELPHMKDLYQKHREEGLEYIGVSLDNDTQKMIDYCNNNDMPWPQYCEGKGWNTEFSRGWGINSIPALFIIDRNGVLRSSDARMEIDDWVHKLLAEPVEG